MSTEHIAKGKYYRILKDKANDVWDRISCWTHADDVELNNGNTLSSDIATKTSQINGLLSDFGTVETSATASRAYSYGECLVYNNLFYRVISPITQGGTIAVDSNVELMTASEISRMLTASNGTEFYFDKKDNQYGFYPNASKTAAEFIPLGSVLQSTTLWSGNLQTYYDMPSFTITLSDSVELYQYVSVLYHVYEVTTDWGSGTIIHHGYGEVMLSIEYLKQSKNSSSVTNFLIGGGKGAIRAIYYVSNTSLTVSGQIERGSYFVCPRKVYGWKY